MKHVYRRLGALLLSLGFIATALVAPIPTLAANTGTISGTVTDAQTHAPVANVKVTAAAPSGTQVTTSDARGFYVLQALIPDTYTVSFQATGYQAMSVPGIVVQQGLTASLNQPLSKSLKTIASVHAAGAANLVKPNQPSDVYTVAGQQLYALSGGNNLHKTLYQYIQGVPGVTSNGFPGQPRIHGAPITDVGYEFDGIPIKDRITGFFTTNLSNVGISNVEVYTGGLSAGDAASGSGVINTVVKTGTYPSSAIISYGADLGGPRLTDLTAEYSGATPNHRYSWYMALDKSNSLNEYSSGLTYPALEIEGDNGPGVVKTTDIIGNFHYRPDNKNDFQLLVQNGLGDFVFGYLMQRAPGEGVPLTANPCPGYASSSTTWTGAAGGTAPNGQPCPVGLYYGTANTQNGAGNIWHHYSGLGKIQWNHIINDHSFFALRFAENFNQYIFDQPIADANLPQENVRSDWGLSGCPAYPYQPGTPVNTVNGDGTGRPCMAQWEWFSTSFFGDRRSNMWLGALDYTNDVNANVTVHAGIGQEYDNNIWAYYYGLYFNPDGSWPGVDLLSNYPTHIPYVYADASLKFGKFLIQPGLRYQREYYDYPSTTNPSTGKTTPGGPLSVGILNPTFAGTYSMGLSDVLRFSYTDSTSFIGSGYIWREVGPGVTSGVYNPGTVAGFSAEPTRIHSADLMWEHQIDPNTTFKIGPWINNTSNAFVLYRPFTGYSSKGVATYGPQTPSNGGIRKAFGAEFALNHVDHHDTGISYWLTGTYDNYWTSITSDPTSSYGVFPLPPAIVQRGNLIRSTGNPLFSGTLTMDAHKGPVSLLPMIYYQGPTFYNTAQIGQAPNQPPQITQNNMKAVGYWIANATLLFRINNDPNTVIGLQGTNVLDNLHDTVPCKSSYLPSIGYGCGPFWAAQNPPVTGYIYQNYSQTPETWQLFFTKKF